MTRKIGVKSQGGNGSRQHTNCGSNDQPDTDCTWYDGGTIFPPTSIEEARLQTATAQNEDRSDAACDLPRPSWANLRLPSLSMKHRTIAAGHSFALTLEPGAHLRIVDLHGQQVVDFMAWALPFSPDNTCEHFSASYTRYRLLGLAPPVAGECLYSNSDRPMFKILEDKVKCHDMLFMACNPSFYRRLGKPGHRSCATNIAEAMYNIKMPLVEGNKGSEGWSGVHDPFNVFQNTPYYSLKALECSRAGDYIELEVDQGITEGVVVALSSCPYEENGFNGGKVTDVAVVWSE